MEQKRPARGFDWFGCGVITLLLLCLATCATLVIAAVIAAVMRDAGGGQAAEPTGPTKITVPWTSCANPLHYAEFACSEELAPPLPPPNVAVLYSYSCCDLDADGKCSATTDGNYVRRESRLTINTQPPPPAVQ